MGNNFQAKVIEDSSSPNGKRITTMQLRYPRFVHAEFMTHRVFSRNASSSRAIPVKKMLAQVWNDPAMPIHWGANIPGMQAKDQLTGWRLKLAKKVWKLSGRAMCCAAWVFMKVGLHKQVANRILEPWQYISVVVTSTEWENFFALRDHPDAQPEIRALTQAMKIARGTSTPNRLNYGEWHLPYVSERERQCFALQYLLKMSAARCARTSYNNHDGTTPELAKDIQLHDDLVYAEPMHASPTEHQATPDYVRNDRDDRWECRELHGNLNGFIQYRKQLELQIFHNKGALQ